MATTTDAAEQNLDKDTYSKMLQHLMYGKLYF
jgi:hypothetical protein